ncbi:MAG: tRNA pseudouridine(55) synthase TruB [Clostridia bacterium]|nr:tRNA pseudouridine(55) synthase TruB [Clostridia bacterium]
MTENFGFVNIIKPTGMTSSDVVLCVKRILKEKRVGHLGTLDPAATGVLPIAVGKATKFFDYFLNKDKIYYAIVRFGIETDTLDSLGKITKEIKQQITSNDLKKVLPEFIGEIDQVPPRYSAVKVNGKKAYELSRNNVDFELKSKKIYIFDIKLIKNISSNLFLFKVHSSAGTYIRKLFLDIAEKAGSCCFVPVIIRTKSGAFNIDDAVTIDEFEQSKTIVSPTEILKLKQYEVNDEVAKKVLNGVQIETKDIAGKFEDNEEIFLTYKNRLIGLYQIKNGKILRKVFVY